MLTETESRPEARPVTLLPKISIVTPSYNQGPYIEQTILSVLHQGYPNLEYIVIDGGSTDESVEIIRRYEKDLTYWESTKDRGQSHAINKGLARCTGSVVNWLCSDDQLMPGALQRVGSCFAEDAKLDVVAGACRFRSITGSFDEHDAPCDASKLRLLPWVNPIWQPSCFFRRALVDRQPFVDEDLHYAMDQELWTYFNSKQAKWRVIEDVLSLYLVTGSNKSFVNGLKTINDIETVYHRYVREPIPMTYWYRHLWLPLARLRPGSDRRLRTRITWKTLRYVERCLDRVYGAEKSSGLRSYYRSFGVEKSP